MPSRGRAREHAVAALLVAGALTGCMGSDGGGEQRPENAGARIGTPVRLADCEDWQRADVRERYGTVEEIRDVMGQPVGKEGLRGRTLDEDKSYEVLDRACKQRVARYFKLYKIYARAVAFGPR